MFTIQDYIDSLKQDKQTLVSNLTTKGISGLTGEETFTELAPKVLDIVTPNNQSKSETITSNTTTLIEPDTGYTGLSSVSITTNVQMDMSEYFSSTITNSSSSTTIQNGVSKIIKTIPSTTIVSGTSLAYTFKDSPELVSIPLIDTSSVTNMEGMCSNCPKLTSIALLNTSSVTSMEGMFKGCSILETIPQFNTASVTNMRQMFINCYNITTIPLLNTALVTNFGGMFQSAGSHLTTASLDNILQMCINATSYSGTKNLSTLGFESRNIASATIQALPHYQDFLDAGWTIGY